MKLVKKDESSSKIFGRSYITKREVSANDKDTLSIRLAKKYIASKMRLERIEAEVPYDVIVTTYVNEMGETMEERRPLQVLVDDDIYEDVSKLLSSYEHVRQMKDVKQIEINSFLKEMKERFKNNIHFAYKKFNGTARKSQTHSIYVYHLFLVFIASISIINDISFKPPIDITIISMPNGIRVVFSSSVLPELELKSESQLTALQGVEVKLAYIASLCREENISNTFQIYNNTIVSEFKIKDVVKEQIRVWSKPRIEDSFFEEFVRLFNYKGREEEEEEQDF